MKEPSLLAVSSVIYLQLPTSTHPLPISKNLDQLQAVLQSAAKSKRGPEKLYNIIAIFISDMLLPISFETAKRSNRTYIRRITHKR